MAFYPLIQMNVAVLGASLASPQRPDLAPNLACLDVFAMPAPMEAFG